MEEKRPGVFSRVKSPFVEMGAYRRDSYSVIANRAAKKCHLNYCKGKILSLFKLNGARILDEDININGKVKLWTMGNYILLMKKSPCNIKLGVGYVLSESSSNSEEDVCAVSSIVKARAHRTILTFCRDLLKILFLVVVILDLY